MTPFETSLRALTSLSDEDACRLAGLIQTTKTVEPPADLVREGSGTTDLHVVLEGWACRYRLLPDGRRQIAALVLPGEICDLDGLLMRHVHYGVSALTRCTVVVMAHKDIAALAEERPSIRRALWWLTSLENAISAEWTLCLGRLSATERTAHLICEIRDRLSIAGMVQADSFPFPITQNELADVVGLSIVHVNRVLQELRSSELLTLKAGILTILNREALAELGCYDPSYLHREDFREQHRPSVA